MMKLYSAAGVPRPVRLSERTRAFAFESMAGKYGDEAMTTPSVEIEPRADWDKLDAFEKYDACIDAITRLAPVRVVPGELITGSATLGEAINHMIPARFGDELPFYGVSHVTLGFDRAVKHGVNALERQIDARLAEVNLDETALKNLTGMKNAVNALRLWHGRYLNAVRYSRPDLYENLRRVPFEPPRSFREAVQSLWFTFAFTRLCGCWPGIGRIDEILGGYLDADLADGTLDIGEARELLAHFFIKGCEWIRGGDAPRGTGDAQHYQNLVLSGIGEDGGDITNEVTYLVLDIIEELAISDFPVTVRLSPSSPDKLLRRVAEVIRHGGGVVAVYNEPLVLESLRLNGYGEAEARRFANDGCWEVQLPGRTNFQYLPFDALRILTNVTLGAGGEPKNYDSYADLAAAFSADIRAHVERQYEDTARWRLDKSDEGCPGWKWKDGAPSAVISLFTSDCIGRGRSYFGGGPEYTVVSPHIGGAPDAANSLLAIKKLVYEEKRLTLPELVKLLENNWEGNEELRLYVRNEYVYYGNDSEEADSILAELLDGFADAVNALNGRCPISFTAGVSTFGRQIDWLPYRLATPFGFKKGEILSGNASPTPGTDLAGATALIKSHCRADLKKQGSGAALDVLLHPTAVSGEAGIAALMGLIRGFIALGGFFMQIDCADASVLRDAQRHPERYKSLSVRVSGWNARFVTLCREWQAMVIERLEKRG